MDTPPLPATSQGLCAPVPGNPQPWGVVSPSHPLTLTEEEKTDTEMWGQDFPKFLSPNKGGVGVPAHVWGLQRPAPILSLPCHGLSPCWPEAVRGAVASELGLCGAGLGHTVTQGQGPGREVSVSKGKAKGACVVGTATQSLEYWLWRSEVGGQGMRGDRWPGRLGSGDGEQPAEGQGQGHKLNSYPKNCLTG